jgi:predicted CopG family antitoxin
MENNITTIQIRENIKQALDKLKTNRESYEEVIVNLMKTAEQCRRNQRDLLIEGCKVMAEESLRITKEWEATDSELNWECDDLIPEKFLKKKK